MSLLQNTTFWYAVAFAIFMAIAYRYARNPALGWIDSEIKKISDELEQAQKLRAEAEMTLVEIKAKRAEALSEAKAILEHAKEEAARLKVQAHNELKESLARHEEIALQRMRQAEAEALTEIRDATTDMAFNVARDILSNQINAAVSNKLFEEALGEMASSSSTAKAKAA